MCKTYLIEIDVNFPAEIRSKVQRGQFETAVIRQLTIEEMVGEGGLSERVDVEVRREIQVFLQRTGRKISVQCKQIEC